LIQWQTFSVYRGVIGRNEIGVVTTPATLLFFLAASSTSAWHKLANTSSLLALGFMENIENNSSPHSLNKG